jgi:hypothetical protein
MGIIPMLPAIGTLTFLVSKGLAMMIAITIFMASSPVPVRWRLPKFLNGGNFFETQDARSDHLSAGAQSPVMPAQILSSAAKESFPVIPQAPTM